MALELREVACETESEPLLAWRRRSCAVVFLARGSAVRVRQRSPLAALAALAAFAALAAPAALCCSASPVTVHRGGGPAASVMAR